MDVDNEDRMSTSSESDVSEDLVDPPSSEEWSFTRQKAREELNVVFQLLKMNKIRDE